MSAPESLSFLNDIKNKRRQATEAWWLMSSFEEPVWKYRFGTEEQTIDWNIEFQDGSNLTDPRHIELWKSLRSFLIQSTRNQASPHHSTNSKSTQAISFRSACKIIDFLILNDAHLNISKYGLAGLTAGDFHSILTQISSDSNTNESIYRWTAHLKDFCIEQLNKTPPQQIDNLLKKIPELSLITPEQIEEDDLDLPLEIVPRVRASLYIANLYYRPSSYEYNLSTGKVSNIIYRNTTRGRASAKDIKSILNFYSKLDQFSREYDGVPVTTNREGVMRTSAVSTYKLLLYGLGMLHRYGLAAPPLSELTSILRFNNTARAKGRFRTLPSSVVFESLRNAIEFHLEKSEAILNALKTIGTFCEQTGTPISHLTDAKFMSLCGNSEIRRYGVETIGLSFRSSGNHHNSIKGEKSTYYKSLRSNRGLLELICVYIGSVQVAVGALSAKRVGELYPLPKDGCLDETNSWLIFLMEKSTTSLLGIRKTAARPIPLIVGEMINTLSEIQSYLNLLGGSTLTLFASPNLSCAASVEANPATYNRNLDIFCDYFETERIESGARYYIRQHQLRRFFALLFFKTSSIGGLETLQWVLGHSDLMQIWNYITEAIDGATLQGAKAQHVAELMHSPQSIGQFHDLEDLLRERYGIENHALVDDQDLEQYILALMEAGELEIEPDFYEDSSGQRIRIIVKVQEQQDEHN